jgi:hypothetical protein
MTAGTPTPQQIKAAYDYANTMKGQGLSTEPVHAWTQGANQMLKALLGNYKGNQADALQRQAVDTTGRAGNFNDVWRQAPAPYMPVAQQSPQAAIPSAPASTYGAGVPFLFGGGMPSGNGGF